MKLRDLISGQDLELSLYDLAAIANLVDGWCGEDWDGNGKSVTADDARFAGMLLLGLADRVEDDSH
jgi:hypothetical protein